MKRKLTIAASIAVLATAGTTAFAAHHMGGKDPMGDKTVTRAEMQQHAVQMFDRLDVNKDGKLDQTDRAAHQGARFDKLDADNNGQISRDEFAAHKRGPEAGAEGAKDGMRHHGGRGGHGGMGKMMLRMADTNKDQSISRAEFDAATASHFDKVDTNKDGQITPEERKAAHEKMRGMMRAMKGSQR